MTSMGYTRARETELARRMSALAPSKLAEFVARLAERGVRAWRLPIVRTERPARLPLSSAQRRLWVVNELEDTAGLYNLSAILSLSGDLRCELLEPALSRLVERHEALRTTFELVDEEPVQRCDGNAGARVELVDLSALPPHERMPRARAMTNDEACAPFDLERGPLLRVKLLRFSASEHWLVFTTHHIVADEWSSEILIADFIELYRAELEGRRAILPELELQYADYALWERCMLLRPAIAEAHDFWARRLADGAPPLTLPRRHARGRAFGFQGTAVDFRFQPALSLGLADLARRQSVTQFAVVYAAFQLLLSHYSASPALRIGTPVANRDRSEVEGVVGCFINMVALCGEVPSLDTPFSEYLRAASKVVIEAQQHQELPFEWAIELAGSLRRAGETPVFQAMLSWHAEPRFGRVPGLDISWVPGDIQVARFDVSLHVTEGEGPLGGQLIYRSELYENSFMQRFVSRLQQLLTGMVSHSEATLAELLAFGTTAEVSLQRSEVLAYAAQGVPELIATSASRNPAREAVRCGDVAIDFAELEHRSNVLAWRLREAGVGPEQRVVVCMARSVDLVAGIFAVLKSGAAYVPCEPSSPLARLSRIVRDCGARFAVGDAGTRAALSGCGLTVLDPTHIALEDRAEGPPVPTSAAPDSAAYVIYTSGSTGEPKGVVVTHRGLANYVQGVLERLALPPEASFAMVSTIAADLGNTALYGALCSGRTLHLLPESCMLDPDAFGRYVSAHRVGALKIVPSHLRELLRGARPDAVLPGHALILGGEATSWELVEQVRAHGTCRIFNHYGPTETTVGVLTYELATNGAQPASATLPLGVPLPNQRVHLLDAAFRTAEVGVPGDVYIAGEGLARGYLGRADQTADRFIPDPQGPPGSRLYRTGDRGRYLEDGSIEFLGRGDDQIKVRGHRVELGEIRAALLASPDIAQAEVVVRRSSADTPVVVAYAIGADGFRDAELTRARLRAVLPEPFVPAAVVFMEAFPVTANGKLDRHALPEPVFATSDAEPVAPRTQLETRLIEIWQSVLKVERVGIHDNFFALGGDSILALRVLARAGKLGLALGPKQFFEAQTVARLAACIDAESGAATRASITPVDRRARLPLSFSQQRLWFLWKLSPKSSAYNVPIVARVTGELDPRALSRALDDLVKRHEVLRTRYEEADGVPHQVVAEAAPVDLPLRDLSEFSAVERDLKVARATEVEASRVFDLERGPVVAARLLRTGASEHVLSITLHHIAFDGWSADVLLTELSELYRAHRAGNVATLPELRLQYADYASWQRDRLASGALDAELQFWRNELGAEHPPLDLPVDVTGEGTGERGGVERFGVEPALEAQLRELARAHGTTLFVLLLAAFDVLLYRYTGQRDLRIGVPVSNRERGEIQGLIGFFVNTLVLRVTLDGAARFERVLNDAKNAVARAQAHRELPFERLVEALNPDRADAQAPLFRVTYNHQRRESLSVRDLGGLELALVERDEAAPKFELSLETSETENGLSGALVYRAARYERSTAERLVRDYVALLGSIVAAPEKPCSLLQLSASGEARVRAVEKAVLSADSFAPQMIARQATRVPDEPAVVCERDGHVESITYAELEDRAARLATWLSTQGVERGSRVAVCLPRRVGLIVSLYAILKSGAAYVPLDRDWPMARRLELLRGASPKVVLADDAELGLALGLPSASPDEATVFACEPLLDGPTLHPEDVAYVIYTSGSTGKPKGVTVTHGGLASYVDAVLRRLALPERASFAAASTVAADLGNTALFGALCSGRTLHLLAETRLFDGRAFGDYMTKHEVGALKIVPSHLREMLRCEQPARVLPRHALVLGGEASDWSLAERIRSLGACRIVNHYGPTETTVGVLTYEHELHEEARGRSLPLGKELENSRVEVLGDCLEMVPPGAIGEIYIGGSAVARGYWDRPDLTAERFVPDPHGPPGARAYRTGDRARVLRDGSVEFLGRADAQVKVRGYRIELAEIESRLLQVAGVSEAAALVLASGTTEARIVAYVVARTGAVPEQDALLRALRLHLKHHLPHYMLPQHYVVLDRLPLNANGKLDRAALPNPNAADSAAAFVAPRDELEAALAAIWATILGVERVGVHDDFFELGGHSLLAVRVASSIRRELGVEVPIRTLFRATSVETLARALKDERARRVTALDLSLMDDKLSLLEQD